MGLYNRFKTEADTRVEIDRKLVAAGWQVQDKKKINLYAGEKDVNGVAIREADTVSGFADYMLFIQGKACGVIEAKREGRGLSDVAVETKWYATEKLKDFNRWAKQGEPLPFLYECTNIETRFRDERDPHPRSRNVFHFHKPETLLALLSSKVTRATVQ